MAKVACHVSVEAAKTVLEVADLAWTALECRHRHIHHDTEPPSGVVGEDAEPLRSENQRLRLLLEKNLMLLQEMSASPALSQNCPPDLHEKLLSAVSDGRFLNELESLRENLDGCATCKFPFDDPSGADLEKVEVLVNVDSEEPSWWVWVSEEMVPSKIEEKSGIDNESYVIVSEEQVVDGVAYFMARCILANPKTQNLTPQELQKALMKAMGGISTVERMINIWHAGMLFYTLATWGLALASLYHGRAVLKLAATGVHHSSRLVMKAL
ncbi:hypothetical protein F511_44388 [Dorcoceras hygrometricum]|uniref:Uncharacterized protein n=1 Tax=Dorcoceras hygrometricum TaxID=472368 RepID=A0A2Z6ZYH4_9LAMI|nr:hypothetical protein F511_44388 [Dorcoceras hygrometricum]